MSDYPGDERDALNAALVHMTRETANLRAAVATLTTERDALAAVVEQVLVVPTLQPGEELASPIPHAVVDVALDLRRERDEAKRLEQKAHDLLDMANRSRDAARAEVTRLREALEAIGKIHDEWWDSERECIWCGIEYGDDEHNGDCPYPIARRALTPPTPPVAAPTEERIRVNDAAAHEWAPVAAPKSRSVLRREALARGEEMPAFGPSRAALEEAPECAVWCGQDAGPVPQDERDVRTPGRFVRYCSEACRGAGQPLNPAVDDTCDQWCGTTGPIGENDPCWVREWTASPIAFCTPACRDAGKPLHPRSPK